MSVRKLSDDELKREIGDIEAAAEETQRKHRSLCGRLGALKKEFKNRFDGQLDIEDAIEQQVPAQ
jgi:hypothetical protein